MFLVDTCGWIEWMTDSPLAKSYSRYLAAPDKLIVPTLIQHELYKWLYREIKNRQGQTPSIHSLPG